VLRRFTGLSIRHCYQAVWRSVHDAVLWAYCLQLLKEVIYAYVVEEVGDMGQPELLWD
jgi:hypothetical protein